MLIILEVTILSLTHAVTCDSDGPKVATKCNNKVVLIAQLIELHSFVL